MQKVFIREFVIKAVDAPVRYPFYRTQVNDNGCRQYWKFVSPERSVLLIREGACTTMIDYKEEPGISTPLTADLLDARGSVGVIDAEAFNKVMNAHIVDLLKLVS